MASRRAKIGMTLIVLGILFPIWGIFAMGVIVSQLNNFVLDEPIFVPIPFKEICCTTILVPLVGLWIYLTD